MFSEGFYKNKYQGITFLIKIINDEEYIQIKLDNSPEISKSSGDYYF
jgi:hypothetical protein